MPDRRIGRIGDWNDAAGSSDRNNSGGPRIATLRDSINPAAPAPPAAGGYPHASDDEDGDDDRDEGESWFAGGERSGISVENPGRPNMPGGDVVRDLLRRAAEAGPPQTEPRSSFAGGGHTLGGDDVESTYIPDPDAQDDRQPTAIRHLTFWRDGFSVEDGELMRYDDPDNSKILDEINAGRAPPHILNVLPNQPVELRVARRVNEDYTPPPKSLTNKIFSGSGHRLGSPVPTMPSNSGSGSSMPGTFPGGTVSSPTTQPEPSRVQESGSTRFAVDQSQPTTSIQLRMADGTRMVCRMNLTHTVGDIRNFINASNPQNLTRPYTIGTTFPNRTLETETQTIKDAGLANSVIVQRWV